MAIFMALIHYPVLDKHGRIVATSITNFDLHDLARIAKTYGISRLYIVNPIPSQQWFAQRIVRHWRDGFGAAYNPTRKVTMELISILNDLNEVADDIKEQTGREALFIATSAKRKGHCVSYTELRNEIRNNKADFCIMLGTGWGFHASIYEEVDFILEPIEGTGDYNHLSVRTAAGIILDRLLGQD